MLMTRLMAVALTTRRALEGQEKKMVVKMLILFDYFYRNDDTYQ